MHDSKNVFQVKVLLRISPSFPGETNSFLKVDQKKKQVTLYDPTAISHVSQKYRRMGVAAPKMFAFDSIFEPDSSQVRNTFKNRKVCVLLYSGEVWHTNCWILRS